MLLLALQLGHNATVALFDCEQRKFLEVVSQEKFDNIKNSSNFPRKAILYLLEKYNIKPSDISYVLNAGLYIFPNMFCDYLHTDQVFEEKSIKERIRNVYRYMEYKTRIPIFDIINKHRILQFSRIGLSQLIITMKNLGFQDIDKKLYMVEHHTCHTYSPIALYGDNDDEWLIFTMDGAGDDLCSTVSIYRNQALQKIASTHLKHSLGYIYSLTTKFLGMKPLEHEYKVMGLASYCKPRYIERTYERIFKDIIWLNEDLTFSAKFPLYRFEYYLREKAVGERFDNLAGALQYLTENLLINWIKKAIEKTGIRKIMTSGGVFMNVKANQRILELPEVEKIFFMPSCGDESNVFGAVAYFVKNVLGKTMKGNLSLYLGMEYTNEEISRFITENKLNEKYRVSYLENIEDELARLLAEFKVVARFAGRAEWGARSLGNRAILANPSDMESFYNVNDQIKARDFWMPFAPTILDTYASRYLKNYNPDKYFPHHMIVTYDTTEEFQKKCRAAMHQGDRTARPQVLTKEMNPRYYRLIKRFFELTGIGALLNTSLNLHGFPLVGTLEQALFTFENSGLRYLALENFLLEKVI